MVQAPAATSSTASRQQCSNRKQQWDHPRKLKEVSHVKHHKKTLGADTVIIFAQDDDFECKYDKTSNDKDLVAALVSILVNGL